MREHSHLLSVLFIAKAGCVLVTKGRSTEDVDCDGGRGARWADERECGSRGRETPTSHPPAHRVSQG